MRFEVSEVIDGCARETALSLLEAQLSKVSSLVVRTGQSVTGTGIEASFGSINRRSTAVCSVRGNGDRGILVADVEYRPSLAFWVFFIAGLFTLLGWLIPLAFYLFQKNTVRSAIESVFHRVKDECDFNYPSPVTHEVAPDNRRNQLQTDTSAASSRVVESGRSYAADPTIKDSYDRLGLLPGANTNTAEEAYIRMSRENDPANLENFSKEIQDLAKTRTAEIRVAYTFVAAHLATRG